MQLKGTVMKHRFLKKKPLLACICCAVTAVTFFTQAPAPLMEAMYVPEYISDLRIFYCDEDDRNKIGTALSACRKAGYTPVEYDLNSGTGEDYVVLGYRTTKMRDQAITDVRTLYMGLGYDEYNLSDVLKAQQEQMEQLARELIICCKEFREHYEAGSPQAKVAYEIFNHFQLDDLEGTPLLGDYLMSDACMPVPQDPEQKDEYQEPEGAAVLANYLNRASAAFTNMLYAALVSAVADYNPDAVYVEQEYEVEVAIPETQPPMTVSPELASSLAEEIILSEGYETASSAELTDETTASASDTDTTAAESETTSPAPETTTTVTETETAAVPADTTATSPAETTAAETETTTAAQAEVTDETAETGLTDTAVLSDETDSTVETDATDSTDDTDWEDETEDTADTTELTVTTAELSPNDVVKLVLNCDKTYSNWAERISLTGMVDHYKEGEIINLFDAAYQNQALNIKSALQDFAKRYQEAQARYELYGDALYETAMEEYSDTDDVLELAEEIRKKASISGTVNESGADLAYLNAYQILDQYRYDENMSVAEYIVKIGCSAYGSYSELQEIYPLLAAMTDGQIQLTQINGLLPVIMALNNTDDVEKHARKMLDSLTETIKDYNGKTYISVFEGVKDEETMVAVTSALKAQQTAGAVYDTLTEPVAFDSVTDKIISTATLITQIAGAIGGVITLGGMIIGKLTTGSIMMIGFGTAWSWIVSGGFWTAIGGIACLAALTLPLICGAVILLLAVIKAVVQWFRDVFGIEKDIPWQDIPGLVFDFVGGYYVNYHPVYGDDGRIGDLNAGKGKRWCAVYYTKATKVGSPLTVPEEGSPFFCSAKETNVIGYTPLKEFDTVVAANLNSYVKKGGAPNIYLHYKTEADVNVPINEGKAADTGKAKYITNLMLSWNDSESAAKTAITKKGYTLFNKNLTPRHDDYGMGMSKHTYCYIGYQTSDSDENAITDIRICPQESAEALNYGTAGYSCVGTTQEGDSIYYTCDKNMGEPITENFEIFKKTSDAPEGWEPVLTFGGFPYDFNLANNNDRGLNGMRDNKYSLYLYFKPSKLYTATNEDGSAAVEYLGGFAYFEQNTNSDKKKGETGATDYAKEFHGGKVHNYNLVGIANRGQIVTCTTYNPKRAIYGMRSYVSSPKGQALAPCLGTQAAGAFVVCDVRADNFDQTSKWYSTDHSYGILPVNSDMTNDTPYGKIQKYGLKSVAEDFEQEGYWTAPYSKTDSYISWDRCDLRKKALYVRGYSPGEAPLLLSEVVFTQTILEPGKSAFAINGTLIDPAEYFSIQDFKLPNATTPHNLSVRYASKQDSKAYTKKQEYYGDFYIYLKRKPVEKPYISQITVKSYDFETYRKNEAKISLDKIGEKEMDAFNSAGPDICILNLLSMCTDEVFPFDLSKLNATDYHKDSTWYEDAGHWAANLARDVGGWFAGIFSSKTEKKLERYNYAGDIIDNVRCWQEDLDKYVSNNCTYMAFSRTDDEMEAIKGIIKYKPTDGKAPQNIKVDNVTYTRCGTEKDMVYDKFEGNYYIYATKETGASPGRPITAVTLNTAPIEVGAQTARTAEAPNSRSKADPDCLNFIHTFYSDEGMYMDAVYLGRGSSKRNALCDLLDMDCCDVILYDLHNTKKDDCVFIGITKYQPLTRTDMTAKASAVRDIRIVTESGFDLVKRIDGRQYQRAIDKYSFNNDFSQAVCLNDADGAYLYFSSAGSETPIDRIGIAEKDRVPPTENGMQVWENVLTESGIRYNLNNSFITFSSSDSDIVCDNRVYLFARRLDGSVKFGAEIVGGHCDEMQQYGELKYVRN